MRQIITRDFMAFGLLAVLSVGIGLLINPFRSEPLPLAYQSKEARLDQAVQRIQTADAAKEPESTVSLPEQLTLQDFRDFVDQQKGLVLDARPEIFHRLGHVPGAYSLPREEFENAYQALREVLESHKERWIVIYCSSVSCEDSKLVKKALSSLGFANVVVFEGGWAEWTKAGMPEEVDS